MFVCVQKNKKKNVRQKAVRLLNKESFNNRNYLNHSELNEKKIVLQAKLVIKEDKEVFNYICTLSYFFIEK